MDIQEANARLCAELKNVADEYQFYAIQAKRMAPILWAEEGHGRYMEMQVHAEQLDCRAQRLLAVLGKCRMEDMPCK